ncbi:MAG: hypothetical protein CL608_01055 [Anaerolineaceae bacterium]|nr:hypothetical protein [Anaerolineaceae bacterium]
MKWIKIWTSLSLLTLLLAVGCNAETNTEPEATASLNEPTIEDIPATVQPTLAVATAVPQLPTTEISRTIRLTPAATPAIEIVPTLEESGVVGEVPEEMMAAVYQDLISTENIAQEAITVTRAEAIIWNDGSLGCPQPGEVYTQATVPGYWIVLEANGRSYNYHAAENGYFILCQNNQAPKTPIVGTPNS